MFLSALLIPDTAGLILPFEELYFFANHCAILCFVLYYIISGKVVLLPSTGGIKTKISHYFNWCLFSTLSYTIFNCAFVSPLAIFSGINIGYSLSPPKFDLISGPTYRLQFCVFWGVSIFIMRGLLILFDACLKQASYVCDIATKRRKKLS